MLDGIFKIKETIDIFISQTEVPDKVLIIFHKMTTRERIELIAGKTVAEFLALIDGNKSIRYILEQLGDFSEESAEKLLTYLRHRHLIIEIKNDEQEDTRYKRQISYFDDMVLNRPGHETQKYLASKNIVILGCGAVGSAIADILARTGILRFVLLDYKNVTTESLHRHLHFTDKDINKSKVSALSDYLKSINILANIITHNDIILPNSDLSLWIPSDADIVINSCDEPYIGHTSLKIGRYLNHKKIPFYVAGGFDAHLMSSGEFIFPPLTPCIDCAQKTFTKALGKWIPTYSAVEDGISKKSVSTSTSTTNYVAGGPGGLSMMSGFSANLAALNIIKFLVEDQDFDGNIRRQEYLINSGKMTSFSMTKQEYCNVCNR